MVTIPLVVVTVLVSVLAFSRADLIDRLALIPSRMRDGRERHRLLTHTLVHGDLVHLAVNMLVLFSFGMAEERLLAHARLRLLDVASLHYMAIYLGGAAVAAYISYRRFREDAYYASLGASAGVAAILFSTICFQPWHPLLLFGILPIPGILLGLAYLIYSAVASRREGSRLDHRAHINGALFGILYSLAMVRGLPAHMARELTSLPW